MSNIIREFDPDQLSESLDELTAILQRNCHIAPAINFTCVECGRAIPYKATICRHCGFPYDWTLDTPKPKDPWTSGRYKFDTDVDGDDEPVKSKLIYIPHPVKVWFETSRPDSPATVVEFDDGVKKAVVSNIADVGYFDEFAEFCYVTALRLEHECHDLIVADRIRHKDGECVVTFADGQRISVKSPEGKDEPERTIAIAIMKKMFGSTTKLMRLFEGCKKMAHERYFKRQEDRYFSKLSKSMDRDCEKEAWNNAVKRRMHDIRVDREARKRLGLKNETQKKQS